MSRLTIRDFLINAGWSEHVVCGMLASMKYESAFSTTALGDKGTSYGLCQWHGGRWTRLKNFCEKHNLDESSEQGQLTFLGYELKTYYKTLYKKLVECDNPYDAGYWFCYSYEIPASRDTSSAKRGQLAKDYYNEWYHVPDQISFELGECVKVKENAVWKNGKKVSKWVPKTKMYIRKIEDNDIYLISRYKEVKLYTGRINVEWLEKRK